MEKVVFQMPHLLIYLRHLFLLKLPTLVITMEKTEFIQFLSRYFWKPPHLFANTLCGKERESDYLSPIPKGQKRIQQKICQN